MYAIWASAATLAVLALCVGTALVAMRRVAGGPPWLFAALAAAALALREAQWLQSLRQAEGAAAAATPMALVTLSGALLFLAGLLSLAHYLRRIGRDHAQARRDDDNFFEMAHHLLCVADIEGNFLRLNPAWERVLGHRLDTLIAPYLSFVHPDDIEMTQTRMAALAEGKEVLGFENRYRAADGAYRWLRWSARPDVGRDRVYAIAEDVTELRAARERVHLLETAIEQGAETVMITDPLRDDNPVVYVTQNCARLTGYTARELMGRAPRLCHEPDADPVSVASLREAMRAARPIQLELPNRRKDGTAYWNAISIAPVFAPDGALRNFLAVVRDATERRQVEDELRTHRERLEQLVLERTNDLQAACAELNEAAARLREAQRIGKLGHWFLEPSSGRIHWSEETFHLYELDPDRDAPTYENMLAALEEDDAAMLRAVVDQVLAEGVERTCEFQVRLPSGSAATHQIQICARCDDAGRVTRLTGVVQDITARKQAESEREEVMARLLRAQKLESLGILAGGIAHDFNNLLMAILGYAGLIRDDTKDPATRDQVGAIIQAADRAAILTAQMLAYTGQGHIEPRLLDLSGQVRGMLEALRVRIPDAITVEVDLARDLPALRADEGQIGQVIMNLLLNAVEAIDGRTGRIRIETGCADLAEGGMTDPHTQQPLPGGEYVWLEVADDGCGMTPEVRDRVFDPFFTTKFTGRGLGLASVAGIVRAHGGAIDLESAPGQGTRFRVYFPARGEALPGPAAGGAPAEAPPFRPAQILVVDDERLVRQVAARVLARAGHTVAEFQGGPECLAHLQAQADSVDLVLLDLSMPGMDGVKTMREIRAVRPDLPIIIMSGFAEEEIVGRLQEFAGTPFLHKPLAPDELLRMVQRECALFGA